MPDLQQMTDRLIRFRRERDWEQFHNPKDQFLSLALEAAELLELAQWRNGEALDQHLAANRSLLEDELADVLGWVLLIAHDRGIDLPAAFEAKMLKNEEKYPADKARGRADKWRDL
jgi:NTP pyrophosphatase (non-canonical NTP hydrolase)